VIGALGLAAVFDLRSDAERVAHPCRRPPDFAGKVFTARDDFTGRSTAASESAAPHIAAAQEQASRMRRDPTAARETMRRAYTMLPFRPALVAAMCEYFAELARLDGASLVNCMAGKDRTGISVALLQRALGVHADDVMEDYLLTNTAGDSAARNASGGVTIRTITGDLEPEALKVMMGVAPEYLDTAFATIREAHGSEEAYLAEVLGADEAMREALRARLVEG
jgi:protein tyrosine/serine phosphatase